MKAVLIILVWVVFGTIMVKDVTVKKDSTKQTKQYVMEQHISKLDSILFKIDTIGTKEDTINE